MRRKIPKRHRALSHGRLGTPEAMHALDMLAASVGVRREPPARTSMTFANGPTRIGGTLIVEIGGKLYDIPVLPSDTGEDIMVRMVATVPNLSALMGDGRIVTAMDRESKS